MKNIKNVSVMVVIGLSLLLSGCGLFSNKNKNIDTSPSVDGELDVQVGNELDVFLKGSDSMISDGFSATYTISSVPYTMTGSVPDGTQTIKIVRNNEGARQSDWYWLRKYKPGDQEWTTNLHVRLKNIAKGENHYELIFYMASGEEWKRKIRVLYE